MSGPKRCEHCRRGNLPDSVTYPGGDGRPACGRCGVYLSRASAAKVPRVRTVWMSFASEETGRNLGVAIVEVTDEEVAAEKAELEVSHPRHLPGAEVVCAAARKAWATGCNPGGQVASGELDAATLALPAFREAPRHALMQRDELERRGLVDRRH